MTNRTWIVAIGSIDGRLRTAFLAGIAGIACIALVRGITGQKVAAQGAISKDELIAEIQRRRAAVANLDVEFSFYAVGEVPAHAIQDDTRRVVLQGNKVRIDRVYRSGGVDDGTSYGLSGSFDGARGWGYQSVNGLAYTQRGGQIPVIDLEGSGFFDLMLWYPCSVARGEGPHPNDLLSVLNSPDSMVSDQVDVIDGHLCYVVDVMPADQLVARIWIDPELGYLAVQQEHYTCDVVVVRFRILKTVQVALDVWLPLSGERVTGPNPNVEELSRGLRYEMTVKEDALGPLLKVNEGVDDGIFDLSRTLPPATSVVDLDTGRRWVASARDYSASADTAFASLSGTTRQFGGESSDLRDGAPWGDLRWLALISAAGLAGAGLLLLHQRRTG